MVNSLTIIWVTKPKEDLLKTMSIIPVHKMAFPDYLLFEKRLNLLKNAKLYTKFNHTDFANAGFFHTGISDHTICYYCGGGLREWGKEDDPWVDHARWFSKCPYVLLVKGKDYVDEQCGRGKKKQSDEAPPTHTEEPDSKTEVPIQLQCLVCMSKVRNIIVFPCAHCCVCSDCCTKIESCIYCRSEISALAKIYIP